MSRSVGRFPPTSRSPTCRKPKNMQAILARFHSWAYVESAGNDMAGRSYRNGASLIDLMRLFPGEDACLAEVRQLGLPAMRQRQCTARPHAQATAIKLTEPPQRLLGQDGHSADTLVHGCELHSPIRTPWFDTARLLCGDGV